MMTDEAVRDVRAAPLLTYWRNLALVAVAMVLVLLSLKSVLDATTGPARVELPFRYRIYAVPIVLSQLY